MTPALRRSISSIAAILLTWTALALTTCGLMPDLRREIGPWLLVILGPSLALLFGCWALRLLSERGRLARVLFWVPVVIGVVLVALFVEGQWEQAQDFFVGKRTSFVPMKQEKFLAFSLLSLLLPCLVSAGLFYRHRRVNRSSKPTVGKHSWIGELAIAGAISMVVGILGLVWFNLRASKVQAEGLKSWTEIGRPMDVFVKTLKPTMENDSFKALLADLKPYGITCLYKPSPLQNKDNSSTGDNSGETFCCSPDALELINYAASSSDSVSIPPGDKYAASMAQRADELLEIYQKILSRPAPVWEANPNDGPEMAVPNFLILRKIAQTMKVDAIVRVSRGDREGAAAALRACDRLSESLRDPSTDSPELVSFMIRVAIDALMASEYARMPEQPGDWEQLQKDIVKSRATFKNLLQRDSLKINNLSDRYLQAAFAGLDETIIFPPFTINLPRWFKLRFLVRPFQQLESGYVSKYLTTMIAYWDHQDLRSAPDFGDDFSFDLRRKTYLMSIFPLDPIPRVDRAISRLNVVLLLREQSLMIRHVRAQMATGQLAEKTEHPSLVIPGAKWEVAADTAARTASLKLTPIPGWADYKISSVIDSEFFILPLDGSRSWKFDLP